MPTEISYTTEFDEAWQRELVFLQGFGFNVTTGILFGSLTYREPRAYPVSESIQELERQLGESPIGDEIDQRYAERGRKSLEALRSLPNGILDSDADILFCCTGIDATLKSLRTKYATSDNWY